MPILKLPTGKPFSLVLHANQKDADRLRLLAIGLSGKFNGEEWLGLPPGSVLATSFELQRIEDGFLIKWTFLPYVELEPRPRLVKYHGQPFTIEEGYEPFSVASLSDFDWEAGLPL